MEKMTNQEAFDKMVNHLRSLKGRSLDGDNEKCVYNGNKCAVGILMTDEEQEEYGNFHGSACGLMYQMKLDGHISAMHTFDPLLLTRMQELHDNDFSWCKYKGFVEEPELKRLAGEFSLLYTKPRYNHHMPKPYQQGD